MHGGMGPSVMAAGAGAIEMISGASTNVLRTGSGSAQISLTAGTNDVRLATAEVHLKLLRTGLPQIVRGFIGGVIDLSDWAPLGTVRLCERDQDVVLSCVTEEVVFQRAQIDTVRGCVTGADLD